MKNRGNYFENEMGRINNLVIMIIKTKHECFACETSIFVMDKLIKRGKNMVLSVRAAATWEELKSKSHIPRRYPDNTKYGYTKEK